MRRRWLLFAGATATFFLVAGPPALAKYQGSDLLGNLLPNGGSPGGLIDKYPLTSYQLDIHVDASPTNPIGLLAAGIHVIAALAWVVTSFAMKVTILFFNWAFTLDLINGPHGALAPVGQAVNRIYNQVLGNTWLVVGILGLGLWGLWRSLVQRRHSQTLSGVLVSLLCVLVAMFVIFRPQETVGRAAHDTDQMATAFLAGTFTGSTSNVKQTQRHISDELTTSLLIHPFAILDFGDTSHCVDTNLPNTNDFPTSVHKDDARRTVCRDHMKRNAAGFGGYVPLFLSLGPGDARDRAEQSMNDGKKQTVFLLPKPTTQSSANPPDPLRGWNVDKADAPAVDIQQQGGALQRGALAVVVCIGDWGAIILIGSFSLAMVLTRLMALVLLAFAPIALIVAMWPGRGHDFFKSWLGKLSLAVIMKAIFALILSMVLVVVLALAAATAFLGPLFEFGIEAAFFWGVWKYRHDFVHRLGHVVSNERGADHSMAKYMATRDLMRHVERPFSGIKKSWHRGMANRPGDHRTGSRQGDSENAPPRDHDHETPTVRMPADATSPPASAGRTYSPNPVAGAESEAPRREPDPGVAAPTPAVYQEPRPKFTEDTTRRPRPDKPHYRPTPSSPETAPDTLPTPVGARVDPENPPPPPPPPSS